MKSRQGIAVVVTLLVSASILIMGLGTMFLTQSNLSIGDNVRANAVAQHRSELIFEASLIALQAEADANGTLPTNFAAPRLNLVGGRSGAFVNASEVAVNYTQLSPEQAVLKTTGTGPREASFLSEGVLELGSMSQVVEPVGLSAGGSVTISDWGSTRITDAAIHGNTGYTFSTPDLSKLGACSSRQLDGRCAIWLSYDMNVDTDADGIPDNLKVTAAENLAGYTCAPSGHADLCEMVAGSPAPRQRREAFSLELDTDALLAAQLSPCDQSYATPPVLNTQADVASAGFRAGQTVCVNGDLSFPSGTLLDGVRVIVEGGVAISGGNVQNSQVIAKDGALALSGATVTDSFLYSGNDFTLTSTVNFQGQTSVVAGANLTFAATSAPVTSGNGPSIGVRVYTGGNLRYTSGSDTFAYFQSNGSVEIESNACIMGSVEAALDINASQGVCIDSGLAITEAAPVDTSLSVVSRR